MSERPDVPHYIGAGVECIDALYASLGQSGFLDHCRATAIGYLWRCRSKGNLRGDLEKARDYIEFALEREEPDDAEE